MKSALVVLAICVGAMGLVGCSTTKNMTDVAAEVAKRDKVREAAEQERMARKQVGMERRIDATPKWALQAMKQDGSGVYAVGFGDSDKMQVALKKAMLEAEFGLAKQYRQELSGSERASVNDRGQGGVSQTYSQLIDKLVASVPVSGFEVVEQEVKAVDGQYSAWVLLRFTHEQMARLASREGSEAGDAKIASAFKDLERRVRERQNDQLKAEEARQQMRLRELQVATELASGRKGEQAESGSDKKVSAQ